MADTWGIEHSFMDSNGDIREVPADTIEGLRQVLGEPAPSAGPIIIRPGDRADLGEGIIELEDGSEIGAEEVGGDSIPLGYHLFRSSGGESRRLIVSPGRCHLPDDLRVWGWASQLYGTRSRRSWGIGDLRDLHRLATWSRSVGAGFVLISPIAAAAPTPKQQANPYYPSSRRFRNPLYLSIEDVPGAESVPGAVSKASLAAHSLNDSREIDRDAVWRLKLPVLEMIWKSTDPPDDFERWLESRPESLGRFAAWSVLAERFGPDWRRWPDEYHRSDTRSVTTIDDQDRIRFHAWLQWCLSLQLSDAGSEIALIQDLPIGFDPGGFDAWEWQDLLAIGASVGAPPDPFNQEGQDWGTPPFIPWRLRSADHQPFVESVRANMAAGGGLRIDHVMGLWRLWCIPPGAPPSEGAYIRFPARELLAILALESRRAGAVIVGEDLGTVEAGMREALDEHDMLSYRLLWFEPTPPEGWPVKSMGAVTTHDLPTVSGLWSGSDLQAQRESGLTVGDEGNVAIKGRLMELSGLSGAETASEAISAAYEQLSNAPSRLLCATLEDAVSAEDRPNMPGASGRHLNWRLALPVPLEQIESHPLADRLSSILGNR